MTGFSAREYMQGRYMPETEIRKRLTWMHEFSKRAPHVSIREHFVRK